MGGATQSIRIILCDSSVALLPLPLGIEVGSGISLCALGYFTGLISDPGDLWRKFYKS